MLGVMFYYVLFEVDDDTLSCTIMYYLKLMRILYCVLFEVEDDAFLCTTRLAQPMVWSLATTGGQKVSKPWGHTIGHACG